MRVRQTVIMTILFYHHIEKGDLDEIKHYYNGHRVIDISTQKEYAFCLACANGHLEVGKWLIQIKPDINISADNDYAFYFASANCHLEVVKWLLQIKPDIDATKNYNYSFKKHVDIENLVSLDYNYL